MKRKIAIAAAVAACLLLALLFWPDIRELEDADIRPARAAEVPGADNAYPEALKIEASLKMDAAGAQAVRDCVSGKKCDESAIQSLAQRNEPALAALGAFAGKPAFQPPELKDISKVSIETRLANLGPLLKTGGLALAQARVMARQRREAQALAQALRVARAGRLLESPGLHLIAYLSGVQLKTEAAKTIVAILRGSRLSSARLRELIQGLKGLDEDRDALPSAFKLEYLAMDNALERTYLGDILPHLSLFARAASKLPYFYSRNRTRALFAQHYREMIRQAGVACNDVGNTDFEPHSAPWLLLHGNIVGRHLFSIGAPMFTATFNRRCEQNFWFSAARLRAAADCYFSDAGRLPQALSELSPKYLDAVPTDPFDGGPLKYSGADGTLSCAGRTPAGEALSVSLRR